jgi:hypothetical protein
VHGHINQIHANIQMNTVYEAQQAAAKRETDQVRRKLLNASSEIEMESDSCVVRMGAGQERKEQSKPGEQPEQRPTKSAKPVGPGKIHNPISDWA